MNMSADLGYLEFQPKKGSPKRYPLENGPTTIGTDISHDIRIKSRDINRESVFCVLDVNGTGVAVLENKCKVPVEYNDTRMKKVQVLKSGDEFVIAGKQFRYVSTVMPAVKAKIESVKGRQRQSVMPNFKVKSTSKIPLPSRSENSRRSLSENKPKREMVRRSCVSALPNRRRNPVNDWTSTKPLNAVAASSSARKKSSNLAVSVRKSLFLRNKGDVSFTDSFSLADSSEKSFVLNIDSSFSSVDSVFEEAQKTPSPRGTKRRREVQDSASVARVNKKLKNNEKFSFNLSISGDRTVFEESGSSPSSTEQESFVYDESLLEDGPQKSVIDLTNETVWNSKHANSSLNDLQNSSQNDLNDVKGVEKILKTPKLQKSLLNMSGVDGVFKTPKVEKSPVSASQSKRLSRTPAVEKTPISILENSSRQKRSSKTPKVETTPVDALRNVSGGRRLSKTPRVEKTPVDILGSGSGSESLLKTPQVQGTPVNALENISGNKRSRTPKVENVLGKVSGGKRSKTPRGQTTPVNALETAGILNNVSGDRRWSRTPQVHETSVDILEHDTEFTRLSKTPKVQRTPSNSLENVSGGKRLSKTPVHALANGSGSTRLSKTPKDQKSPLSDLSNISEIGEFFKTPQVQKLKTPRVQKSPKNDLTDIRGVKKLLKTPKVQNAPKNDLTDIKGVKQLLTTPKTQKSPKNDLGDVRGVKQILRTPRVQKSPENDFTDIRGVKKLLKTPKPQNLPRNDLTNVGGVKQLLRTPKIQKPPKNDLTDVRGVKKLMKVQKSPLNDLMNISGVDVIMRSPEVQNLAFTRTSSTPKLQKSPVGDLTFSSDIPTSFIRVSGTPNSPLVDCEVTQSHTRTSKTPTLKRVSATPRSQKSTPKELIGDDKVKTPQQQKSGLLDLADDSEVKQTVKGTPKLSNSPFDESTLGNAILTPSKRVSRYSEQQKSLLGDWTDDGEAKQSFTRSSKTPQQQMSPLKDLTDDQVHPSVKRFLKVQESRIKNLTTDSEGNTSITPRIKKSSHRVQNSPKNDLTDVRGVKKMFATPKVQKSPENNLSNFSGISKLMKSQNVTFDVSNSNLPTPSTQNSPVRSRRGRRNQPITSTPAQETETSTHEITVTEESNLKTEPESNQRNMRVTRNRNAERSGKRKSDVREEIPQKRVALRKRKQDDEGKEEEKSLEVPQKRGGVRGRGKKLDEEKNGEEEGKIEDVKVKRTVRGRGKKNASEVVQDQNGGDMEEEKVVEAPQKRGARGKPKKIDVDEEKSEEIEVKRTVRGRGKKNTAEVVLEQNGAMEEVKSVQTPQKRVVRGRGKKVDMDEENNGEVIEVKRNGRARAKKNVEEEENNVVIEKPKRGRKLVQEAEVGSNTPEKASTRNKRKVEQAQTSTPVRSTRNQRTQEAIPATDSVTIPIEEIHSTSLAEDAIDQTNKRGKGGKSAGVKKANSRRKKQDVVANDDDDDVDIVQNNEVEETRSKRLRRGRNAKESSESVVETVPSTTYNMRRRGKK